jgi:predicted nucleic acid-binding protein
MTRTTDQRRRDEYIAFINGEFRPHALPVSASTDKYYADIIGRIWQKYPPANPKLKTEAHLVSLGIDINDVWAVAVAWEHGLTFVTQDKMEKIREVISEAEVPFECWI